MGHAQMHRRFMGLYHGIQERIKALEHCATEGDLLSQLCEFQIDKKHEGEMCVMCQEEMCCGEQALKVNTCGHVFHDECVRRRNLTQCESLPEEDTEEEDTEEAEASLGDQE